MMWSLPSKTLVIRPIAYIKGRMMSSLTITMSPMVKCHDGDFVHLAFCCREVKYSSFQRFQNCRTMLSMALICRLSDVLLSRVELGNAVNGRLMRKCPGVKASAELSGTDEIVVAFSQLFGRKVVSEVWRFW